MNLGKAADKEANLLHITDMVVSRSVNITTTKPTVTREKKVSAAWLYQNLSLFTHSVCLCGLVTKLSSNAKQVLWHIFHY